VRVLCVCVCVCVEWSGVEHFKERIWRENRAHKYFPHGIVLFQLLLLLPASSERNDYARISTALARIILALLLFFLPSLLQLHI